MRKLLLMLIVALLLSGASVRAEESFTDEDEDGPGSLTLDSPTTVYDNAAACQNPQNLVVAENCQEGSADWVITNLSPSIEGFASATSVNVGESIDFYVNTSAPTFDLYIYRTGYYGGKGGRLLQSFTGLTGRQQPDCYSTLYTTGLVSCSTWHKSHTLSIPEDWVSGYYVGKLVRPDTGGENYLLFVVRDDARRSDILFQQSVTTTNAYNNWGGKSVYTTGSRDPFRCLTVAETSRAVAASFKRPLRTPLDANYLLKLGYPMLMWLEAQGYDVTYNTNVDTHRAGKEGAVNTLLNHKVVLLVGHDEYWSQEMYNAVESARDAGVSIGVFSANTAYWRVRFEDDPVTGEPETVMVTYKSTEGGPADPSGHPTGTWRDPDGANHPENQLLGVMYIGDNDSLYFPLRVTAEQAQHRVFRGTGLESMPPNTYINLGRQIIGWEWDVVVDNDLTPDGLEILTSSPAFGGLITDAGKYYTLGEATPNATLYTAPGGALVFASGTNLWSWGLELVEPDRRIQQMTYNVLAEMGALPLVPAESLVVEGETPDRPMSTPDEFLSFDMSDKPVISNIQVKESDTQVTVTWETDRPAMGQVWLRSTNDDWRYPNFPPSRIIVPRATHFEYTTTHQLTARGLDRSARYRLHVAAVDEAWRVSISPESSFTTQAGSTNARLFNVVYPLLRSGQCFVETNRPAAIGIGLALVAVVGFSGWRGVRWLRGRGKRA